jgi:lambda repressor-like predicted transcriptional regulator
MNARKLIAALKKETGVSTDQSLRRALGLSPVIINSWRSRGHVTPKIIARQICVGRLSGGNVISTLRSFLKATSLRDLSRKLGVSGQAIQNWKNRSYVTARQVAGIVKNASVSAESRFQASAIRPLVEFFPLARTPSKQGAKFELFSTSSQRGNDHLYLSGLRDELRHHHGIYIFFDSRGQAIYAGKARKLSLWKEITNAFNRERGGVQKMKSVRHPKIQQRYKTSDEKARQIRDREVSLHEIAAYFSAYQVTDSMIDDLEALLVRSFANDLLNKRMEQFGHQKATKRKLKTRRKKKLRRRPRIRSGARSR